MEENKFNNALARAQQLMLDENFNAMVERKASAFSGAKNKNGSSGDLAALEAQAFGRSSKPVEQIEMIQEQKPVRNKTNSKLPAAVLESFEKLPPQTEGMSMMAPPASYYNSQTVPQQPQYMPVNETVIPQPSIGIDYNYIKYLIDESIKSHMMLNESAGNEIKGMRIKSGSIIQFLDSKGNLYEGKMVLKKKATN